MNISTSRKWHRFLSFLFKNQNSLRYAMLSIVALIALPLASATREAIEAGSNMFWIYILIDIVLVTALIFSLTHEIER